ncbi:uncharacterized protein BXZ73DRAFT_38290 [Epithele typhae]|uniref:uncharacterized protein n=1 Tax=Epithele typhae TaxID=378194 RepID=UPI002007E746|nr:uncharacterized protein BXZ73DRAFT_38290 [Epithele typhae]KAH9945373.1 hypothetical protein BXZ73DRAFT_38290 [Epithele typhae]
MTFPRLPAEIVDEILSFLHAHPDDLRACSRVSRSWLPRARCHLFRHIVVDPSSDQLLCFFKETPDVRFLVRDVEIRGRATTSQGWWMNGADTSLSLSRWPTLGARMARSVRSDAVAFEVPSWLREGLSPSPDPPSDKTDQDSSHPSSSKSIAANSTVHHIFPLVHTLRVSEFTLSPGVSSFLAAAFPKVTTLTLSHCRAMSFADLTSLFLAFPRLRALRLLSAEWLSDRKALPETYPRLELGQFEVSQDIHIGPLVDWLLAESAHRSLRILKCSIGTRRSAGALRALLSAAGSTLEHIQITLSKSPDPTSLLEAAQLDFTPCTRLRALHVPCGPSSPTRSPAAATRSLSWVLALLAHAGGAAPALAEIRLVLARRALPALNLEGLDVVLARTCYARLARLEFDVADAGTGGAREDVARVLAERMPIAHGQALLRLDYRAAVG